MAGADAGSTGIDVQAEGSLEVALPLRPPRPFQPAPSAPTREGGVREHTMRRVRGTKCSEGRE